MAAMFLAKRGIVNISSARSVVDGVSIITSSRHFASQGNSGREKTEEEAMGTTTDGKAPNVTMSRAAETATEGMKQALDAAIKESGDASKPKSAENDEGSEEDVAVGENGTVKGQNQSSG